MPRADLSADEARRMALAARGFDRARPRRADARQILRVVRDLGLLQLDYVNVLVPAHYQLLFSRLGTYASGRLDESLYRRGDFTEQWAHERSVVPIESWPLFGHRREAHPLRPRGLARFLKKDRGYPDRVLGELRARGPLAAEEVPEPKGERGRTVEWRGWSVPKAVLEWHFGRGLVVVVDRRGNFTPVYDLAERRIPREHLRRRMARDEAHRELLTRAARAHGVGTAGDLADYFRMSIREARPRLGELVETGELREVRVEGWRETAYLYPKARVPARIDAAALLSPFDPVVWHRERVARLFGFDYRIEIFVPKAKRKWGYYVLPFLLGDRLVARVDLKADRAGRRLVVLAAYLETGARPAPVAEALGAELRTMAAWLNLDSVDVGGRSGFARTLAASIRKQGHGARRA